MMHENPRKISSKKLAALKKTPFYPVIPSNDNLLYAIEYKDGYGVLVWLSVNIQVKEIVYNEKTNECFLNVDVTRVNGDNESGQIEYKWLSKQRISEILKFGWAYDERYSSELITYLIKASSVAPQKIAYQDTGWCKIDDTLVFKTDKCLCGDNSFLADYQYCGGTNFEHKCIEKDYFSSLNALLTTDGSKFAIVAGLSSALLGRIKLSASVNSIMLHIFGSSSTGKTTFLHLACSCWGNPYKSKRTWNSTENALYALLEGNNGIVTAFDEASGVKYDFANLIYTISDGQSRMRCGKDSSLREVSTWATTVITTAENSLIDRASCNDGLKVRCFEFFNLVITKDSQHSFDIDRFIRNNYGVLGELFAEKLLEMSDEELMNDYLSVVDKVHQYYSSLEGYKKTQISERVFSVYALLVMTASYAQELGVDTEVNSILDVLQGHYEGLVQESKAEMLYNAVMTYIYSNGNKFAVSSNAQCSNRSFEGYTDGSYYYVVETVFNDILQKNNISDSKVTKTQLCDEGYMVKSKDRFYHKKTIGGKPIKFYKFKILSGTKGNRKKGKE